MDITTGDDFIVCVIKRFPINVSDFGRLRTYGPLKPGINGKDY